MATLQKELQALKVKEKKSEAQPAKRQPVPKVFDDDDEHDNQKPAKMVSLIKVTFFNLPVFINWYRYRVGYR
jgi:hypothetical protein